MSCPDADTLAALDGLAGDERAAVVDHAATCEACRAVLRELVGAPVELAMAETLRSDPGDAAPAPDVPETIDRYRIERRIGAGAMGIVYAAYDPELARPVAIKVLRAGGSPERMRREAQALARLAHPNVVAVYDVGEHAGSMFVTMALVDGENLRAWLAREHATAEILAAVVQAARGVTAAHRAGIVHRDLKPDNIFVARTGDVLVGDFGLARSHGAPAERGGAAAAGIELSATGTVVGTPAYMAPEQLAGDASEASDQFALCVTAWEALYGTRPFTGKTLEELLAAAQRGPPPDPRTRDVPARVRAAIRRGLAANPDDRHPSLAALLAELEPPPRRRWPYVVAAGVLAAGAAAAAVGIAGRGDERGEALARCNALSGPPAWDAARRDALQARFPAPIAEALEGALERYAGAWTTVAREACAANARRELADPQLAAAERCLARRADTLAWVIDQRGLAGPETLLLVEHLEPVASCRIARPGPPPSADLLALQHDLDRLLALVRSAAPDHDPAGVITDAERLGDEAALAEAHFVRALVLHARGHDADAALVATIAHADRASDDRLRTRATAIRAAATARAGRLAEARTLRDLAASATARSADPLAEILVERARIAIARAQQDVAEEIAALRRIEAAQRALLGEPSLSLTETRFELADALQRARDPQGAAVLDGALATLRRLVPDAPLDAFAQELEPAKRIAIAERVVAIARREDPKSLPLHLKALGYEYEIGGDYARSLAVAVEALSRLGDDPDSRDELLENAAAMAVEVAIQADDKPRRRRFLDEALAYLDRLSPERAETDANQTIRGRALVLKDRYAEAIPLLTVGVAAAEKVDPPHPLRVILRSLPLAQALWETGGTRERERARALADRAAALVPAARAMLDDPRAGAARERLERVVAELEAWRRTHR